MNDDSAIGQRARIIRRRRGLSVEVAAGLAGISTGYLSMLERGLRNFERRGVLENLAGALGCSVADLTGQPYLPPDRDTADALAAVPGVREALHSFGPDDVPDVAPRPLEQLTRWAAEANEHTTQARYSLAGRDIGAVVTELTAHAHTAGGSERAEAVAAAVLACFAAGVVASRTGHADLAVAAAQRGYELAARHSDAAGLGFARWYWAMELTSVAARDRAHAVAADGIDELTPWVSTGHTADTRPAEVVGLLHLQQARAAARAQRADDAQAHLAEAAQLAERTGERNGFGQHFGPTNVATWRVPVGIELGDGPRAAEEATRIGVTVDTLSSAERSSSAHLDLARGWAQAGGDRDAEALRYLDAADRIARSRTRPDPIARELVETLSRRARRRMWELDSLRNRFGII